MAARQQLRQVELQGVSREGARCMTPWRDNDWTRRVCRDGPNRHSQPPLTRWLAAVCPRLQEVSRRSHANLEVVEQGAAAAPGCCLPNRGRRDFREEEDACWRRGGWLGSPRHPTAQKNRVSCTRDGRWGYGPEPVARPNMADEPTTRRAPALARRRDTIP